jgi:hypothetical protein
VEDDDLILDIGPDTTALLARSDEGRHHRLEWPVSVFELRRSPRHRRLPA